LTPGDAKRQAEILARVVTRDVSELPLRLSCQLRHHAFMLVHNALPTHWRDRHLPHTLPGTSCALCGRHPETSSHLFLECCVSKAAIKSILDHFFDRADLVILPLASIDDIEFRSKLTPNDRLTLLAFTCAVWKTRELRVRQSDLNLADATRHIATSFASLRATAFASPRKDRRPVQRQEFLALLPALPPNSLRVFTDGSSYDALRAGAGFTTCAKRRLQFGHSQFLGPATNNFAELTALTLAARYCATRVRDLPPHSRSPVFLLTDNRYAINTATSRWTAKSNLPAITALKSALKHLVAINWVPAHCNIFENKLADLLAKRGANGVTSSSLPDLTRLNMLCHDSKLLPIV
jgi:ribonuclease HI